MVFSIFLLPDSTHVESQLITLQDVTVNTAALAGARSHDGVQTGRLDLALDGGLDLAVVGETSGLLLLNALALLLLGLLGLGLASPAQGLAVVRLVPLTERSSINLDDGRLGQGVGTDQFVVGRVVRDTDHTGLAGNTLGAPGEVTGVETEGTELLVTTASADQVNSLSTDTGVGGLTTLVERSVTSCKNLFHHAPHVFSLVGGSLAQKGKKTRHRLVLSGIPLLAVVAPLRTGGRTLVTRVARNTHDCG